MQLEQTFDLAFPRETAWAAFQDVPMLVSCLPGASLASAPGVEPLEFGLAVKLGPIAAKFAGQGGLTYGRDYTGVLAGGGTDRGTGSRVKGSATFALEEKSGGTRVRLSIDYSLTGALAQFARSGIARELAAAITRQFAANLQVSLEARATGAASGAARPETAEPARLDVGASLWNALTTRIRAGQEDKRDDDGRTGLGALLAAWPQWTALAPASRLLPLEGRWLLHAGPPLADPRRPPPPLLSSAVLACLHEGWAQTEEQAEQLVTSGAVRLQPAQDQRCVTPLAALVTPSTPMIVVEDRAQLAAPAYAPLGAVGGADLRFGTRDAAVLERLALRDQEYAKTLAAALTEPVDLLSIAAEGVAGGDDLHNRTAAATAILASRLAERYRAAAAPLQQRAERLLNGLGATPLFFLTFWMAAAKLILSAAEQGEPHTLVTRMGGNGEAFGLSLAGRPTAWITAAAIPPRGAYLPGVDPAAEALGAIGDSAVIDALGFGGQALHASPEASAALQPFLPSETGTMSLLAAAHPAFTQAAIRVGLDAARVVKGEGTPMVTLAMVEKTGRRGLLGRGVLLPGKELFARAVQAL
jgi:carbon monoxide dehydrogenase subunit G